jgi:hypothetical protein
MKKILLLSMSAVLLTLQMAAAQTTTRPTDPNIPTAVLDAFNAKYPNMAVKDWDWEEDKNMYEAEFNTNGKEHEAFFSPEGTWMKTITDIKKNQLPSAVSNALSGGEYNSWNMSNYAEMETPEYGKVYKVKVGKGKEEFYLKYDLNGKLVEKKSKAEKKSQMK